MKKSGIVTALMCVFLLIYSEEAKGSGYDCSTVSSSSFAQGNSVVAHSDDASVIFFNPALMNKLDQSQIMLGTGIVFLSNENQSAATGNTFETEDNTHFLPRLFAVHHFNERISAGLGVFSNFGLCTEWDENWEGRYLATKSELKTYTINPAVSVKVSPNIYIAGGIDVLALHADLNKHINLSSFMLPDIKQKMSGDDMGLGYNLGLLFDISKDFSLGASYRSKIKVDVDGDVEHSIPAVIPPEIAFMFPDTSASTTIELPPQAFIGLAYKGLVRFIFQVSWKWIGWSSYKELKIKLDESILGQTESVSPKNWKDSSAIHLGAQYRASDIFTLNAGYIYENSPIPNETFEPAVPDNDAHTLCLGTDINYKKITVGLMYAFKKYEDRDKNNMLDDNPPDGFLNPLTSANGEYKTHLHIVGIDITYRF